MDLVTYLVDFFLHLDRHLAEVIQAYGPWTYALLVRDRLPGDGSRGDPAPPR